MLPACLAGKGKGNHQLLVLLPSGELGASSSGGCGDSTALSASGRRLCWTIEESWEVDRRGGSFALTSSSPPPTSSLWACRPPSPKIAARKLRRRTTFSPPRSWNGKFFCEAEERAAKEDKVERRLREGWVVGPTVTLSSDIFFSVGRTIHRVFAFFLWNGAVPFRTMEFSCQTFLSTFVTWIFLWLPELSLDFSKYTSKYARATSTCYLHYGGDHGTAVLTMKSPGFILHSACHLWFWYILTMSGPRFGLFRQAWFDEKMSLTDGVARRIMFQWLVGPSVAKSFGYL